MKRDIHWVLAPGSQCVTAHEFGRRQVRQLFAAEPELRQSSIYFLVRPNSRLGAFAINRQVKRWLDEFRRPTTFIAAAVRVAARSRSNPVKLLEELTATTRRLIDAEFLIRADVHGTLGVAASPSILRPRQRFAGYRVRREVHRASATEVYEVQARDRTVYALKVAQAHRGLDQARKMLRHEIAMLKHLGPDTAAGRLIASRSTGPIPFAVLEWIDGESLAYRAEKLREAQSTPALCDLVLRFLDALASIHARKIVHGDIHPGNFLVDSRENVRVLDFGLAQSCRRRSPPRYSTPGGVLPFVSPEVAAAMLDGGRRMAVRPELDVYAAGAVVFYLLTGEYPLALSPIRERALVEIQHRPIDWGNAARRWPVAVQAVLSRAMAKRPDRRYSSVQSLRAALSESFGAGRSAYAGKRRTNGIDQFARNFAKELGSLSFADYVASAQPPHASLAFGAAGLALCLLKASHWAKDPDLAAKAHLWIEDAISIRHRPAAFLAPEFGVLRESTPPGSLFYGRAGLYYAKALITHAIDAQGAFQSALDDFAAAATSGVNRQTELVSGQAGALLGAALLKAETGCDRLDDLGGRIYAQLENRSWEALDRYGFAHGEAGVLYALLSWASVTGASPSANLLTGLSQLAACGIRSGRGIRWPIHKDGPAAFMCSWCNGTPGMVLLWLKAYEMTANPLYRNLAEAGGHDIVSDHSAGSHHLCCGLAGKAYALLALSHLSPRKGWRSAAIRLANQAIAMGPPEPWRLSLYKGLGGLFCLSVDLLSSGLSSFPCVGSAFQKTKRFDYEIRHQKSGGGSLAEKHQRER